LEIRAAGKSPSEADNRHRTLNLLTHENLPAKSRHFPDISSPSL